MKLIAAIFLIVLLIGMAIGYIFRGQMETEIIPPEKAVRVTAYSPDSSQTDETPFVMASGKRATIDDLYKLRYCAVSPDLKKKWRIRYGDRIVILVEMELEVQDITNRRLKNTVDLFMRSRQQARGWGVKKGSILKIKRRFKR
jgi:3D (Asp-Asp-Asp) domain-containing protein